VRIREALSGATLRTLPFRNRDIHGEYFAQFTCGGVAVKIVGI
jgi:hypothetical protein